MLHMAKIARDEYNVHINVEYYGWRVGSSFKITLIDWEIFQDIDILLLLQR